MAGLVHDMFDPGTGSVVPADTRTDGTWIWQEGLGYYLDTYHVGPEPDLYRVIVDRGYPCPPVSPARTRLAGRALAEQQRFASQMHHEQRYGDVQA
ncbi:hypothetical protein ABGB14_47220 [Nonomuraea sp. B10E15]|uniref:hypothetical protein n=1 Tax=Nonomuraea sp. B10E15 TaxID=3153560 RepID=UPI00325DC52B